MVEEVWVEDPRGRRIQQWLDADLNQGMLQREMLLGEVPRFPTTRPQHDTFHNYMTMSSNILNRSLNLAPGASTSRLAV